MPEKFKELHQLIADYDTRHKENIKKATFTERKVFAPVASVTVNDPVLITDPIELVQFVDTNQPLRFNETLSLMKGGLESEEYGYFEKIINNLCNIFHELNGVKEISTNTLVRHLYQRYLYNSLIDEDYVLEVGPGSGYLSLLLALDGKSVISTDPSQALYLYQNLIFNYFGVNCEGLYDDVVHQKLGKINHLPWWSYKDLDSKIEKVDCVIVNHAICEMPGEAIDHLLHTARELGCRRVFMEGTGMQRKPSPMTGMHTFNEVIQRFTSYGFLPTYGYGRKITAGVYIFEWDAISNKRAIAGRPRISNLYQFFRYLVKKLFFRQSYIFLNKLPNKDGSILDSPAHKEYRLRDRSIEYSLSDVTNWLKNLFSYDYVPPDARFLNRINKHKH